jgi:hypothetical protein
MIGLEEMRNNSELITVIDWDMTPMKRRYTKWEINKTQ